jgi:2-hydroxychromene-2-carboxylate isomerase
MLLGAVVNTTGNASPVTAPDQRRRRFQDMRAGLDATPWR